MNGGNIASRRRIEPHLVRGLSVLFLSIFVPLPATLDVRAQSADSQGPAAPSAHLTTPKMSFEEASRPYEGEKYVFEGYVGKDGKVKNGGLGCSGYASAVLHRMRDGDGWLKTYSLKPHTLYGDEIAQHFGLKSAGTFPAADLLDPAKTKQLLASGKLTAGTRYLFNVRKDKNGHVGFIQVDKNGNLSQHHYSGIKGYEGLATGDLRKWLKASMYKGTDVELFHVGSH